MERTSQVLTVIFLIYSKDVRLPVQLQRAMAAEAEAAREARAKVTENPKKYFSSILKFRSSLLKENRKLPGW